MKEHRYYVYILSNKRRSVLYTGVTNDLSQRLHEHRAGVTDSFTKRYNVCDLVHVETFPDINDAIAREKQIKSWSRKRKDELVAAMNPGLRDLSGEILGL